MNFISEEQSSAIITHEIAYTAAHDALIAAANIGTTVFPAIIAHGSRHENRFSIKSAATADVAGLKVGSYWPGNTAAGIPRHNSAIMLFNQRIGRIEWFIEAGTVNAFRTAAADAVAAQALARQDASTLAVFGAGHQALYECLAITRVRTIKEILVVARDRRKAEALATQLQDEGFVARSADARNACEQADIIVTVTSAHAPLFEAGWIQAGTHIATMGSDAAGKQELPPALFERAALFCDLPSQAFLIGEFQHFEGDRSRVIAIGDVLSGRNVGRTSEQDITIFDSSGVALQDLYIAKHLTAALEDQLRT